MGRSLPTAATSVTEELSVLVESEDFRPRPDFKIFTRGMEVLKDAADEDDGARRIRCIASSSVKDLHGDIMTASCVRSMAKQAEGLTIFLNHQYRVPDDVFGMVEKARTKKVSSMEAKANGWLDKSSTSQDDVVLLQLDIKISKGVRSDETFAHIESGVTLGVSIGANITDFEEAENTSDSWWPPLIINDVDLLEASIVGIPANPLSWVEGATKGLITKGAVPGVTETTFRRAQKAVRAAAATDGWEDPKVTKTTTPDEQPATDEAEVQPAELAEIEDADGPEMIVAHYQMQIEQGLGSRSDLDAMESAIQRSIDYALEHGVDKGAFDGRTAADLAKEVFNAIPADEADEDPAAAGAPEGDQEAPADESDPESDDTGADEKTDKDAAKHAAAELKTLTESGVFKSMNDVVDALEGSLKSLFAERARADSLELEKMTLVTQLENANADVVSAVQLVNKMLSLPIGRKAIFRREAAEGVSSLKGGPYGDDVLAILYPSEGDNE